MKKNKFLTLAIISFLLIGVPLFCIKAEEAGDISEITASDIGFSETAINNASSESETEIETSGTLIEIGNTTAEETTIIVRVPDGEGGTVDETLEVNTQTTEFVNEEGDKNDLSNWIAGDTLKFKAKKNVNTGELTASQVRNRAMKKIHKGKNGWIKEIRTNENEIDVIWGNSVFTLNLDEARMVAGLKNPATIEDLKIGDRIRARVEDDEDGNNSTWNAKIVVVLRRGKSLFMRVTRWVVPARIISMPESLTASSTITVEILPNKFYQEGDVNNLIGAPGTQLEVDLSHKTDLRRRYLGKCFIREFSEGDNIRIVGRLNEETGRLDAKVIKNNSIQRLGVAKMIGTVETVGDDSLEASLANGRKYTVNTIAKTNVHNRGAGEIEFNEISPGDKIRVRGTLNRLQKEVTATTIVIVNKGGKQKGKNGNKN